MSIRKPSTLWSRGGHGYSGEAQGHGHFDESLYRGSKAVKQSKLRTDSWNPGSITSPTDEGNMDSIPGPGRCHMPRGSKARAPQLLNQCSRARGLQVLKPARPRAHALHQENHCNGKPTHLNAEQPPLTTTRESL